MPDGVEMEFTSEEVEQAAEFSPEEFEGIEEELINEEVEALEDTETSEDLEAVPVAAVFGIAGRNFLKVLLKIALRLIRRIAGNRALRTRLQGIVRQGGQAAFCRVFCQLLSRVVPPFLRPIVGRLCPVVCRRIWPLAVRQLGLAT